MDTIILFIHIAAGFTALLTGGVAISAPKGRKVHIIAGRIYFWSMAGVALSALCLSVFRPNPFLFFIGLFSFFLTWSGYKAIRWKNGSLRQFPAVFNNILILFFLCTGCMMTVLSLLSWAGISVAEELTRMNMMLFAFGLIFAGLSAIELKHLITPESRAPYWWLYSHIGSMTGAYIATFTAFLVVNNEFLPDWVAWLGPTVIGTPLISWWIRTYRKRLSRVKDSLLE